MPAVRLRRAFLALVLAAPGCGGVPGGGTVPMIATVQPGDEALTCDQISVQMAQMDQIIVTGGGTATGAMTNSVLSGALSASGQPLGGYPGSAADMLRANAAQSQPMDVLQAQARRQELGRLYDRKGC